LLAFNATLPARNEVLIDVRDLDIKQGKITIKATATPNEKKTALEAIDALEEGLKKSECFKEFTSGESQPGPNETREFSMTIKSSC
jgi:hypothetical protein